MGNRLNKYLQKALDGQLSQANLDALQDELRNEVRLKLNGYNGVIDYAESYQADSVVEAYYNHPEEPAGWYQAKITGVSGAGYDVTWEEGEPGESTIFSQKFLRPRQRIEFRREVGFLQADNTWDAQPLPKNSDAFQTMAAHFQAGLKSVVFDDEYSEKLTLEVIDIYSFRFFRGVWRYPPLHATAACSCVGGISWPHGSQAHSNS